jgi:hypothetical protein
MISKLFIPILTGFLLGIAQASSRAVVTTEMSSNKFSIGIFTLGLYMLACALWITVLKSPLSLTNAYANVVLGVFAGIISSNTFYQRSASPGFQDCIGILVVFAGTLLIRR